MPFNNNGYNTIGGHSRRGTAIQIFTYKTNDTLTEILTAGYFNDLRHKVRKDDLIFVHREDTDGQNPSDLILKITLAPITENITVGNAMSDDWSDDGSKLTPLIDGRDVSSGSGSFIANSIDANKIVETDGDKKLVSIDKNTAYNKNFKTDTPAADTDAGDPGDSTDIPKGNHAHPKTQATEAVIGQSERADQAETNAGTDDLRHITPLKLAGRTATETRTGIAEIATQPETDAETDDTRIITPLKLAGKKASQAEAESAIDNTKIMTPLRTKQFAEKNLGLKIVEIQNNATDPNNDIDFKVGRMWNHDRTKIIDFPTLLTKYGDTTFAEGNNQGGLASGVSWGANVYRHLFIIKKADGTVDAYIDDNITANNIPSGFVYYKYVNTLRRDGSGNIEQVFQKGNLTLWKTPVITISETLATTTAQTATLKVPPDIVLLAKFAAGLGAGGATENAMYYSSLDTDDIAPAYDGIASLSSETNGWDAGVFYVKTNTSSQIRYRNQNASAIHRLTPLGWVFINEV